MDTNESLKQLVKEQYGKIAEQTRTTNASSCCGATGCGTIDMAIMADDYTHLSGYAADADLGLGCGLPTQHAYMKTGDTVIDLGSGAGNDAFVARAVVGSGGRVIGIDFTEKMIEKARTNAEKLGYNNVEFRQGDIEQIPVSSNTADVIVSNCVMNLVPDKAKAFSETHRVLKPGGHFSISDIVLRGELPVSLLKSAEMYAGCVAGALQQTDYLLTIKDAGFVNLQLQKEKKIVVPDEILSAYMSEEELMKYKTDDIGIYSITVYAEKPEKEKCAPGSGCC
jgi:arsenite methyltransferase